MPTKPPAVEEKVSDWLKAYNAIRYELTPEAMRAMMDLTAADSVTAINLGVQMARIATANDRAAAIAAAMLTQSGVSRPTIATDGIEE